MLIIGIGVLNRQPSASEASGSLPPGSIAAGTWASNDIRFAPWGSAPDWTDTEWSGTIAMTVGGWRGVNGGDERNPTVGTAANPIAIENAGEMARLAFLVNGGRLNITTAINGHAFTNTFFQLTDNIDLTAREWVAIGGGWSGLAHAFDGSFDGSFFTVSLPSTLRSESMPNQSHSFGLFGTVSGDISNLSVHGEIDTLRTSAYQSTHYIGMLAGYGIGANFKNITISGSINLSTHIFGEDHNSFGTVMGASTGANGINLVNRANISGINIPGELQAHIGGIVGLADGINNPTFINLANYGNIDIGFATTAGGLIGQGSGAVAGRSIAIVNSYNIGDVTVESLNTGQIAVARGVGGILGSSMNNINSNTLYSNLYNMGEIRLGGSLTHTQLGQIVGNGATSGRTMNTLSLQRSGTTLSVGNPEGNTSVASDNLFFNDDYVITNGNYAGNSVMQRMNQVRNESIFLAGTNRSDWAHWIPATDNPLRPTFDFVQNNLTIRPISILFNLHTDVNIIREFREIGSIMVNDLFNETFTQEMIDLMAVREIEFIGFASSRTNADQGMVAFLVGGSISIIDAYTTVPLSLFAVYQFSPAKTLTIHGGDGILVTRPIVTRHFVRPGVYVTNSDGTGSQLPFAFAQLPATADAVHIGWAISEYNARIGLINTDAQGNPVWPLNATFDQPLLHDSTEIWAVWRRLTDTWLQLDFSLSTLDISPLPQMEFSYAQMEINLGSYLPPQYDYHTFVGWNTNFIEAQAGIAEYAPATTLRVPSLAMGNVVPITLFAVWRPIRLTINFNTNFNVGMPTAIAQGFASIGTQNLFTVSGLDPLVPIQSNGFWFQLMGFSTTVGGTPVSNPTAFMVNNDVELFAVWQSHGQGTQDPPPTGLPPLEPPNMSLLQLAAPNPVTLTDLVFGWTHVFNSIGYRIYINGTAVLLVHPGYNSINLADYHIPQGSFIVQVRAVGDNVSARHSDKSYGAMFIIDDENENTTGSTPLPNLPTEPPNDDIEIINPQQLGTPNASIAAGSISWDTVSNATAYRIYINGAYRITTMTTSVNLTALATWLGVGNNSIEIIATSTSQWWTDSNPAEVSHYVEPTLETLPAPTNVRIDGDYLRWNTVANSTEYEVEITRGGNIVQGMLGNYLHLYIGGLEPGTYVIRVRAIGTGAWATSNWTTLSPNHVVQEPQPSVYDITWILGGGVVNPALTPSYVEYGTILTLPTSIQITREGYIFDGWTIGATAATGFITSHMVVGAVAIVANWTAVETPVEYDFVVRVSGTQFLNWDNYPGAHEYKVLIKINEVLVEWIIVPARINGLSISHFMSANYTIQIHALDANENVIAVSNILVHQIGINTNPPGQLPNEPAPEPTLPNRLDAPINVSYNVDANKLMWTGVAGSTGYAIYLNGVRIAAVGQSVTAFTPNDERLVIGTHIFSVRALGNPPASNDSYLSLGDVFHLTVPAPFIPDDNGMDLSFWHISVLAGGAIGLLAGLLFVLIERNRRRG